MKSLLLLCCALAAPVESHDVDLLVVGGTEAGVSAAVQAARLGVAKIALVNDIDWLGGQFSAEAVGAIDEWTIVKGKRVNFPRSGLFLEVMQKVREFNGRTYGITNPGNAVTASDTIEPAAAARIFEELVEPVRGQVTIHRHWQPIEVLVEKGRVVGVVFEGAKDPAQKLTIRARLVIDASDWGDVVRLSGARHFVGPDPKSRFGEASAPGDEVGDARNEMNPISYCLVARESKNPKPIPAPEGYDERSFHSSCNLGAAAWQKAGWPAKTLFLNVPSFTDSSYPEGMYSPPSVYTQRRLVDRVHNALPFGSEKILFNWVTQDYPLYGFPKALTDRLEATEAGASKKNIAEMNYAQRRLVFEDAKRHSLGMLHYLQQRDPKHFGPLELTDEFTTPDRCPPKPYVREGLRLDALYVLREQDIRTPSDNPGWAKVMVPDAVFGFQFNIDFHPTRRQFLKDDPAGPWGIIHTPTRNWSTHTDRAMFPVRGLVPTERNGLIGASKNIGLSSITSAALRLHGQMMLCGQSAGTLAFVSLRDRIEPREVASDWEKIHELQRLLVRGSQGKPGVLLWPYHDLPPEERHFEAANLLAVYGVLPAEKGNLDFEAWKPVTMRDLSQAVLRALRAANLETKELPAIDKDTRATNWADLHRVLKVAGFDASNGLTQRGATPLYKADLAIHLWRALQLRGLWVPRDADYLKPGHDADGDGIEDRRDPLPFDRDNNNVPDRIQ